MGEHVGIVVRHLEQLEIRNRQGNLGRSHTKRSGAHRRPYLQRFGFQCRHSFMAKSTLRPRAGRNRLADHVLLNLIDLLNAAGADRSVDAIRIAWEVREFKSSENLLRRVSLSG